MVFILKSGLLLLCMFVCYNTSALAVMRISIDVGCFAVGVIFNVLSSALCILTVLKDSVSLSCSYSLLLMK